MLFPYGSHCSWIKDALILLFRKLHWSYGLEFWRDLKIYSSPEQVPNRPLLFQIRVKQLSLCKVKLQGLWFKNKWPQERGVWAEVNKSKTECPVIITICYSVSSVLLPCVYQSMILLHALKSFITHCLPQVTDREHVTYTNKAQYSPRHTQTTVLLPLNVNKSVFLVSGSFVSWPSLKERNKCLDGVKKNTK